MLTAKRVNLSSVAFPKLCLEYMLIHPSASKSVLTRVAIEMHSLLDKQNTIHRDAIDAGLSLDTSLIWKPLCLLVAKRLQASAHGEYVACLFPESPFYMSCRWIRVNC
jgi:hypothetical protein